MSKKIIIIITSAIISIVAISAATTGFILHRRKNKIAVGYVEPTVTWE